MPKREETEIKGPGVRGMNAADNMLVPQADVSLLPPPPDKRRHKRYPGRENPKRRGGSRESTKKARKALGK